MAKQPEMKGNGRIVYSGDTRPCQNLINYSRGCSLLIHEATFDHDMLDRAKARKHTTSEEVISVVNYVKPWRTILTHFSIRNQRMPEVLVEYNDLNILLAFD